MPSSGQPAVVATPRRRATAARPCCSTRTTTCSRPARTRTGSRRRSSRRCAATACTAAAPPTTRRASWRTSRAIRALRRGARDDFDLGIAALHRGRGGVRLPLVRELPRTRTATLLARRRDRRRRLGQLGPRDPGAHRRAPRRRRVQPARSRTLDARLALRHVRGSGARRDARRDPAARHALGRPTARSRSTGCRSADARDARLRRGAAARRGRPARRRHARSAAARSSSRIWDEAVDHGHRHRRTERRERVEHARPRRARAGQRAHRARPGRAPRRTTRSRRTCEAHAPFGAQLDVRATSTLGQPFLVDTSGWAVAETHASDARGLGREPVEIGVGGSIPFIADLVERVPRRADPRHRRRGPRLPGAQPERVAAPRTSSSARCSAEALLLARLDARDATFLSETGSHAARAVTMETDHRDP